MDYLNTLDNFPTEFHFNSFKEKLDKTKELFEKYEGYITKPMVKCCVIGNLSSGKSTLINALLERNILYEGLTEGTLCAAKCQSSSNNEEYFKMYEKNHYLDGHFPIKQVKDINRTNSYYSKYAMDTSNYLDIYLNIPNNNILENFLLIDCPGINNDDLDAISNYCDNADIIVFCFRAEAGITDHDIEKINRIKKKIERFQINFIINCCDVCDSIDKHGIIFKLSPHLTGEDAIFFISALEEKKEIWNDARHREFELFKKYLEKQKSLAAITYRKVYLDLIGSVNALLSCLNCATFQNYRFSDKKFAELQEQIFQLINNDKKLYYTNDSNKAMMDYSTHVNKEISTFMMKQFNNDCKLNDGIIDENYLFKRFIKNDDITQPNFSWYEWGVKNEKMKKSFLDYFTRNSTKIENDMKDYYCKLAESCLDKLQTYKNGLQNIIKCINELVMGIN